MKDLMPPRRNLIIAELALLVLVAVWAWENTGWLGVVVMIFAWVIFGLWFQLYGWISRRVRWRWISRRNQYSVRCNCGWMRGTNDAEKVWFLSQEHAAEHGDFVVGSSHESNPEPHRHRQ